MDIKRLETIVYAEGFVESFLEGCTESATAENAKQAEELKASWSILSAGLKELRRENAELEGKVSMARVALS